MRRYYVDNVRWVTVVIVVIYHVLYMYNTEGILGGLGRITDLSVQYYDIFMYLVYPWFMPVLFIAAGMSSRYFLDGHSDREFVKNRTRKLLVPSTIGLIAFQFIQGYVNLSLGGAFADLAASGVPGPVIFLIMLASGSGVLWFIHLLWIYSPAVLHSGLGSGAVPQHADRVGVQVRALFCLLLPGILCLFKRRGHGKAQEMRSGVDRSRHCVVRCLLRVLLYRARRNELRGCACQQGAVVLGGRILRGIGDAGRHGEVRRFPQ